MRTQQTNIMSGRLLVVTLLALLCGTARAQVTTDVYKTTYSITWSPYWEAATPNHSIRHKTAKWYEFRDNLTQEQKEADTFNDEDGWTTSLDGKVQLQATNTSVDTIYVHKGSNVSLAFPYLQASINDVSVNHYNRWFDFRTDGNYHCDLAKDGETIADLLTPRSEFTGSAYRFVNGYVQIGINTRITSAALDRMEFYYPTDEEFGNILSSQDNFNGGDNSYYVIACDVSGFNDTYYEYKYDGWVFGNGDYDGTDEDQREFWEPTLEGRAVFYIIGVEDEENDVPEAFRHYWDFLNNEEYHGGTNTGEEKYLEEYDIVYPSRRTSAHTNELVALSKAAEAYAVPNDEGSSTLNVSLVDGGAGVVLDTYYNTISGSQRIMQFYKDGSSVSPWKVDNNSTATILVTKTVGEGEGATIYNIARYRLTFKDSATPLTQTQVAGLATYTDEEKEKYWWGNMGYRSPQYIADTYESLTSLTFSYDTGINGSTTFQNGQSAYYPYPLDWNTSSYAFYDGCAVKGGAGDIEGFSGVAYSMYAITNGYIGETTSYYPPDTAKDSSGYWLYIDASDYPGVVAELEFEEKLCIGSQLVGTAWIKSAAEYQSDDKYPDDAAVLLTIMGVHYEYDTQGNIVGETHTPIYRQCSSQIRKTTWLNGYQNGSYTAPYGTDEDDLTSTETGKGSDTNEWFQIYFSFVNSSETDFDRYTLRVDNYCASTAGGDFYFDDVEVYVLHPAVSVTQVTTVCSLESDMNPSRFDLGYESIMSRLGHDPDANGTFTEGAEESIDFLMINETKYFNYISEHSAEYADDTENIELRAAAIEASVVTFWANAEDESEGTTTPTIHFYLNFEENEPYDDTCDGTCNVIGEDGAFFYHRIDEYGNMMLSLDCYTNMSAYTPYIIILEPSTESEGTAKYQDFAGVIGGTCTIESEYYISSTIVMRVNGEIVNPTETYCVGQTVNVTADVSYENAEGETVVLSGVYFDWFFGDKETYITEDDTYGVSLQEALLALRNDYPDAGELSEDMKDVIGEGSYGIIYKYLNEEREGGLNNTLMLHQSHLALRILDTGIEIVCQPIPIDTGEEYVCFGYVPLTLSASGSSPLLNVGFHDVVYPNDEFVPNVRLGLSQIEKATWRTDNTTPTPITVNLRNATYVTDGDDDAIDHLGEIGNNSMDKLYLIDSDDPYYLSLGLEESDFSQYSLPVGKIERIYAREDNESDDESTNGPYMRIYFYGEDSGDEAEDYHKTFNPREGYYYVLTVNFEEKNADGTAIETPCQGSFPLELKVVPEYLVWTGGSTSNWNNDSNWKRADRSDIHKTAVEEGDEYPAGDPYLTNKDNTTDNGFVPMLFTKVIMPKGSEAELYMAGFIAGTDGMLSWQGDEDSVSDEGDDDDDDDEEATSADVPEHPTPYIMYDLMVYNSEDTDGNIESMKTEHYRVNLCDEIHFEPGAQLLHSEQLIYNKAWTDVEIEQGPWTLAATPLRDVVSGDWYTKKATGTETAEYFTDIVFTADSCDRLNPMVYQRNWSNSDNTIVYTQETTDNEKTVPAYASTGWSSVYNDVNVAYQAGEGFSVKASRTINSETGTAGNADPLMFRFPKADLSYTYQDGSTTEDDATSITRTNPGRLLISGLVDRSNTEDKDDDENVYTGTVSISLTQTGNNYYIIGNPYTAPMSMSAFIEQNPQFLGYWTEATYGPVAGTATGTSWGTDDCLIEPYSAFFVTTEESDVTPLLRGNENVTFTKDMQEFELSNSSNPVRKQTSFAIRAEGEGGTTSTSIAYTAEASDDYRAGEDAVLMEDESWQRDGMPLVYTVAGDKAVSVNSLKRLALIPVGVFADEGNMYTLSFAGVSKLEAPVLIDTYEDTETPITEGLTLDMEGPTHGRYFIRTQGMATDIDDIEETAGDVNEVSVYSPVPRTVVVSSDAGIESVDIYSIGGMLLKRANAGGSVSCTIDGVASGIAIVRVKTTEGTTVRKIRVR